LSSRREGDGNGGGDIETFIRNVVDVLRQRGAMGIRAVRLVARGLEDLAQSAMSRDQTAFEEAVDDLHRALEELTK
jgi:hypothetical protein